MKNKIVLGLLAITCALAGLSTYTVETGEVAILSQFGKVYGVAGEGLNFKLPIVQSKKILVVRNVTYNFNQMSVSTKDMQTLDLDLKVQISIKDPENVYKKFKTRYEEDYIRPRVNEIVQANISKYTIEEFVSKRQQLSLVILRELQAELENSGFIVENISIVNHDSDQYEKAIEAKKVAEQKVETAKFEQEKIRVEANNRIELEKIEQEKKIIAAKNKIELAQYELKEKELKAKANRIESESLSPNLLRKMELEKWDGKLPQIVGNGNLPVVNIK
ncbi:prohibitin family protein [uncultured Fusobacterium sp.]|uniref:prohibitin family protein n=1 Tax=uncultured Fusobacterium sp. TaxID=159267 RepID=UPI0025F133DA|nr:prohibitin family protein [uncultured Fusobacterium sp.]